MPRLSELMPHKTCRTGASSCFKTCSQRRKLDSIYMRQCPATRQRKLPNSECCKHAVNKTALLPGVPQEAMQARNSCRMRVFGNSHLAARNGASHRQMQHVCVWKQPHCFPRCLAFCYVVGVTLEYGAAHFGHLVYIVNCVHCIFLPHCVNACTRVSNTQVLHRGF